MLFVVPCAPKKMALRAIFGPRASVYYVLSGPTSMSYATQVVKDVVEREVGCFTCLREQQWYCHESVHHSNCFVKVANINDSSI